MIELSPTRLPALSRWLPAGAPGSTIVGEHVLTTGVGRWWADRPDQPRVLAVSCAGHVLLRGTPDVLDPDALIPLANSRIEAPARFLPTLQSAFDRLTRWDGMAWTMQTRAQTFPAPRGVTVRRLEPADTDALLDLGPGGSWIYASWGSALGLTSSGHGWVAVDRRGRIQTIACTYFRGIRYEDVTLFPAPDTRNHRLQLACVRALTAEITARGHIPSWNCSVQDRASRLLAWNAGFRLVGEYVNHEAGSPVLHGQSAA